MNGKTETNESPSELVEQPAVSLVRSATRRDLLRLGGAAVGAAGLAAVAGLQRPLTAEATVAPLNSAATNTVDGETVIQAAATYATPYYEMLLLDASANSAPQRDLRGLRVQGSGALTGISSVGGANNGEGIIAAGGGSGLGVKAIAGGTAPGVPTSLTTGVFGSGVNGVEGKSIGNGNALLGIGGADAGTGLYAQGGVGKPGTNNPGGQGMYATGGNADGTGLSGGNGLTVSGGGPNGTGVSAQGTGTGQGLLSYGGADSGEAVYARGGNGKAGTTNSGGYGITSIGGTAAGTGLYGGVALEARAGGPNGTAVEGFGAGNGSGLLVYGGADSGLGAYAQGGNGKTATNNGGGTGISTSGGAAAGSGTAGGIGLSASGGSPNGLGVVAYGSGTAAGVQGYGGASSGTGVAGQGGGPNGFGVDATGAGTAPGVRGRGGFGTSAPGLLGQGGDAGGNGATLTGGGTGVPLSMAPSGTPGPPGAGAHAKGDVMVDSNGIPWVCIAQGTPGTFVPLQTGQGTTPATNVFYRAVITTQPTLLSSNGVTWTDMDTTNLKLTITPMFNCLAVLTGNCDLWTDTVGYNQDMGITVSGGVYPTTAGQPEAWKESGGPASYSPNAAFVQAAVPLLGGTAYTIKLQWKTSRDAPGAKIWAGAGPIGGKFSPTSLTASLIPTV